MRHRRGGGGTGAGAVYAAGRALGWGRPRRVMAGTLALALVLGLASLSFVMRATGSLLPNLPPSITERASGLAPAPRAALVGVPLPRANRLLPRRGDVPAGF